MVRNDAGYRPSDRVKDIFVGAVALLAAQAAAETVDYTWLTVGKPSGEQNVTLEDGRVRIDFRFNDRGRGPDTETLVRLDERGFPTEIGITGTNYEAGTVDERFVVEGDTASWSSSVESGQVEDSDGAYYWPNNAPPYVLGMLARAVLDSPSGSVALLPTGTATVDRLAQKTLTADGDERQVTLYGVNGLGPDPAYVWLDQQNTFFGADYGWFGITPVGFEGHIDALKEAQEAAADAHFKQLAERLTKPLPTLTAIRGARIFDSLEGNLTDPATVFIWDGKISAIYFEPVEIPEGATVIEAEGHTLLPTLWDMHGHVRIHSHLNYLAAGVTNVRDMANDEAVVNRLVTQVRAGEMAGPDVYPLGFIDKRGEFSAPTGRLADDLEAARDLVDYYAQRGFSGIKLYSSVEPDWVAPIAERARARGMTVQGHVPAYMNARQAIDAGYDEITHVNMVLLNFLGAEELDTRTPVRFKVPGERASEVDLSSDDVRAFIALMKRRDIELDPTLSIFIDMFRNEPGKVSPIFRDIADHFPANTRRASIASAGFNEGNEAKFRAAGERTLELVRLLHDSGVQLLPGTDNALPGFTLIRELRYYVEAGIPAGEALQLATIDAARHLQQDQRLGSVTIGKDAHIYLVDGDPLQDMTALYRVRQVIKGRRLYHAPDILRAQGFRPF